MNAHNQFGDEWLEDLLRNQPEEITDDGFSERLLVRLKKRQRYRTAILWAAGAVGAGLALWPVAPGSLIVAIVEMAGAVAAIDFYRAAIILALLGMSVWFVAEEA